MKEIIKSYGGTVLVILVILVASLVVVQLARRSAMVRNWFTV